MSKYEYKSLLLTEIDCGDRLRDVSQAHVEALVSSILEHGQQTPLSVRKTKAGYQLLAGMHRISALGLLEKTTAECKIYLEMSSEAARLFEIDENLVRHELNPLDRAVFLSARKSIYEELYPDTKAGVAGGKATKSTNVSVSFVDATAEKLGLGKRSIERAVRIATKISPDLRKRLNAAGYIKEGELYNLTKFDPAEQGKIIDHILNEKDPAANVKAAADRVSGKKTAAVSDEEKQFSKLVDCWVRASGPARKMFRDYLETTK
ncbi:ParB/RepB/Spo0J family partition protein [Paremcibacter congregatus]|uniref:ParB/RepB/Spo0J family partition protein n=1 Tax=Paremcibacter congregatus TaxID=2043170 RepID=UPI0030EB754A|tara:strand:+ start:5859 stop:6647 length:789 start_codon:yes stop_codon:yes gene_type:complete